VFAATAVPAASLGVFRWIVGLFQLLIFTPHYRWIDDVPHGLFDPPEFSFAYLVGGFPPSPFFTVLDVVGVLALVAMTIGWNTRVATLAVVVVRLIGTTFTYSFGKIDHTDTMLMFLLTALAFSSWGEYYTLSGILRGTDPVLRMEEEREHAFAPGISKALAVFATVLAFGMFTAGIVKLRGWVDFDQSTSGVLRWFYPNRDMLGRDRLLARFVPGAPQILLELGDYLAVLMELSSVAFLLAGRRAWLAYLAVLTTFHLANVLVLNIAFSGQVMTYLAFAGLVLPKRVNVRTAAVAAGAVAVVAGVWAIGRRLAGGGGVTALVGGQPDQAVYLLYLAMFVSFAVLVALLAALRREWANRAAPAELAPVG
jgi:hypothetical protein